MFTHSKQGKRWLGLCLLLLVSVLAVPYAGNEAQGQVAVCGDCIRYTICDSIECNPNWNGKLMIEANYRATVQGAFEITSVNGPCYTELRFEAGYGCVKGDTFWMLKCVRKW